LVAHLLATPTITDPPGRQSRGSCPRDKSTFEAEFRLKDFVLDPCVYDRRDELPERPDDLVLTAVWSFTATGGPTGLEVTEVELIPATP
jgi:hypothetical protein